MLIYVVIGSTGEYSNHDEWLVKAFPRKDIAQRLVSAATREAERLYAEYGGSGNRGVAYLKIPKGANSLDPNMRADYTGVRYHCVPVELEEKC